MIKASLHWTLNAIISFTSYEYSMFNVRIYILRGDIPRIVTIERDETRYKLYLRIIYRTSSYCQSQSGKVSSCLVRIFRV